VSKKQFYVYAICVDGVVRYIGKGSNGRVHFHVIEAGRINRRRARGANTDRTATKFYRKLAEAILQEVGRSHEAWGNHYRRDYARWPHQPGGISD
jgi:hypothetical protein